MPNQAEEKLGVADTTEAPHGAEAAEPTVEILENEWAALSCDCEWG